MFCGPWPGIPKAAVLSGNEGGILTTFGEKSLVVGSKSLTPRVLEAGSLRAGARIFGLG